MNSKINEINKFNVFYAQILELQYSPISGTRVIFGHQITTYFGRFFKINYAVTAKYLLVPKSRTDLVLNADARLLASASLTSASAATRALSIQQI